MATYTEHYGLHQWESTDDFLRTDFNADFAKIDAGIRAAWEEGAEKCRMVYGTYTGNGTYGEENPNTLEFGFLPRMVMVVGHGSTSGNHMILLRPYDMANSCEGREPHNFLTWLETGVKWHNYSAANFQFNQNGVTYHYLAFE